MNARINEKIIGDKKRLLAPRVKVVLKITFQGSYQARRVFAWKKILTVFKE